MSFFLFLLVALCCYTIAAATTSSAQQTTSQTITFSGGGTNVQLCSGGRTLCGISSPTSSSSSSSSSSGPFNFIAPSSSSASSAASLFSVKLAKQSPLLNFAPSNIVQVFSSDCGSFSLVGDSHKKMLVCDGLAVPEAQDSPLTVAINVTEVDNTSSAGQGVQFGPVRIFGNSTAVISFSLPSEMNFVAECGSSSSGSNVDDQQRHDEMELDNNLLFPASAGTLLNKPALWPGIKESGWLYPGKAAIQMAARRCGTESLYIQTRDTEGHAKSFSFEVPKPNDRFFFSTEHYVDATTTDREGGASVVNYTTLFSVMPDVDSWEDAAVRYRQWLESAEGFGATAARLVDRAGDVPAYLRDGKGVAGAIWSVETENGFNPIPLGSNLEKLPSIVAGIKKRSGIRHFISTIYGWEAQGTWAGLKYFPASPSSAAYAALSRALARTGDSLALLVSGYWWVVKRRQTRSGPAFDNSQLLQEPWNRGMLIENSTRGTMYVDDQYDAPTGKQAWRGFSVKLCEGSAVANKNISDIFVTAATDLGAGIVSFDQQIAGGNGKPCFSSKHGHPPGFGAWSWRGFRSALNAIRARTANAKPPTVLMSEQCSELATMSRTAYVSCWSREFAPANFPFGRGRDVGVFSFATHEYNAALAAALVQGVERGSKFQQIKAMANAVARGLILMPFAFRLNSDHDYGVAYENYARAFAQNGNFLVGGRMLKNPKLNCSSALVVEPLAHRNQTFCAVSVGTFAEAVPQSSRQQQQKVKRTFVVNALSKPVVVFLQMNSSSSSSSTAPWTRVLVGPLDVRVL